MPSDGRAAVIRVTDSSMEMPRPVRVEGGAPRKGDAPATTQGLYRIPHSTRAWYLVNRSRLSMSGPAGRVGETRTRWEVADDPRGAGRLRDDWHAMTMREFLVLRPEGFDVTALAAVAARLCQQSGHWDGRTALPAPLQLAALADEKHPNYRTEGESS
jgi:hypothetical protein